VAIYEIVKGKKYKIVIEAGRDPATGKRKRITRNVSGRKHDAEMVELELKQQLKQGAYIEPKRITVREWLNTWLKDYKKNALRINTYEIYEILINKHIIPALGGAAVQELRPEHIQKLYNDKIAEGLSPKSVRHLHTILRGAFRQAKKNRLVSFNITESVTLPALKKGQARALTLKEQAKFLAAAEDNPLYPAFMLLMTTGLRRGELLGLRWRNVNLTKKYLEIEENFVPVKGGAVYQQPKTEKSKGKVPLIEPAVECLKKHRQQMLAEGLYDKDRPVFCNDAGGPIMPRSFNHRFEKLREKAGVGKAVTVHSLRHTFATRLLERGVSMKEVQELLRHEEMSTTADIYSHVSEELKRAAANRLTDLFQNGTKMAPS
jgi:integrase